MLAGYQISERVWCIAVLTAVWARQLQFPVPCTNGASALVYSYNSAKRAEISAKDSATDKRAALVIFSLWEKNEKFNVFIKKFRFGSNILKVLETGRAYKSERAIEVGSSPFRFILCSPSKLLPRWIEYRVEQTDISMVKAHEFGDMMCNDQVLDFMVCSGKKD